MHAYACMSAACATQLAARKHSACACLIRWNSVFRNLRFSTLQFQLLGSAYSKRVNMTS
jgi:hypothetical protein